MEFFFALLLIAIVPQKEFVRAQESLELPIEPKCGKLNENEFLNLSHIAGITEHPWIGRLGFETDRGISYLCLAILITNQHLLAPAHCFDDNENNPVRYVLLGDWNPTNPYIDPDCDARKSCNQLPKLMEIAEIAIHPEYITKHMSNDISVIKLTEPLARFTSSIRPICIPNTNSTNDLYIGRILYSTGFARNSSVPYKLKSLVQILGGKKCRNTLSNLNDLSAAIPFDMIHLCGVGNNMPLIMGSALMGVNVKIAEVWNYYLIGILVGGEGTLEAPYVFLRVDLYSQWMQRFSTTNTNNLVLNLMRT